jgi:4-amino-4-deoxy-L-arabinose transferase-like glycosyltransferase
MALALRLYNLGGQPAGLWRDESRHGLQALQIWSDPSYRPVYVAEGADLPALLFYLMAPVVGLLGPQVWSDRLVSAVIGGLTPLAVFWAASPLIGRRPALIAAALLAWASWGLSMSRWAFPATLDHLLTLTAVGLAWRSLGEAGLRGGLRHRLLSLLQIALAALCAGLATYAYHTGRVAPIALAVVVLLRLGRSPAAWRRALPGLLVAAAVGLITMAPLLSYIAQNYADYNRRVGAVSVLNTNDLDTHTPLGLLLRNGARYLLMWHVQGEPNGRHHLPDAPMLDPATGLLLLLGLALALRTPRSPERLTILAIPLVYAVPAIFSSDAPHAMRALGMLAPACMLAALALDALLLLPGRRSRQIIATGLLAFSLGFNTWIYFGVMRVEPKVYGEFDLLETALGQAARAPSESTDPELRAVRVYLPDKLRGEDTLRFLTYGVQTYGYTEAALPADGPALLLLPADATPAAQDEALAALGPGATPLDHVPVFPGTNKSIILAFGRGEAAGRLLWEVWP